jgi:hypothetical protein
VCPLIFVGECLLQPCQRWTLLDGDNLVTRSCQGLVFPSGVPTISVAVGKWIPAGSVDS